MNYTDPKTVISPKTRWVLLEVLTDTGEHGHSISVGIWDKAKVLAIRWNGSKENSLGNPQSRGIPTWFVLPEEYYDSILNTLPSNVKSKALVYLEKENSNNSQQSQ